ncbi:aminotransferase class I/II-fold pyridoxal phosphate-dependent enzyme [Pyxidicoccus fallax]|uniref:Aminotransferase class I/II-fold pyridoxal phosphate-dependent enzyme n=1 Tax=Pyxidicoccus fallax TaxID=394095 RepID=A0A848LX15_9BACT|nr:histidinol-phosphate transaminase [Pyxidicoccus fallax]NMO22647.1 aminotransferase class I/II-fold pyridoxal phosphate-dependent enzyme [Pyxidicoccus fallax]NPC84726.1 aminotransferase class I/II-fold pyridoxal phosphate-dependent enzyme [Pyxidicoccus fallax]
MLIDRRQLLWGGGLAAAALATADATARAPATPGGRTRSAATPSIRLSANENPYGPSASARRAIQAALGEGNRYARNAAELEAHVARRDGLTPEHVVLTPGSQALLCLAALWARQAGGEVVASDLAYSGLTDYAERLGVPVHRVPMAPGFVHDLDAMEARVTPATKLVYVCNPNNPTGTVVDPERLRAFCEAVSPRALVVVDEAYGDYVLEPGYASMAELVKEGHNVLVARTFSKLHALAGMRVGYGLAPTALADALRKLRMGGGGMAVNVLAVHAALASAEDTAFQEQSRRKNAEVREHVVRALRAEGLTPPVSHANFVYVPMENDVERFGAAMEKRGVRIVASPPIRGLRITVGTAEEMARFAEAFKAARAER